MPIGLGLASSHAPNMFLPAEKWAVRYRQLTQNVPQPPEAERETLEVLQEYEKRIQTAFSELERRLAAYRAPDRLPIMTIGPFPEFSS